MNKSDIKKIIYNGNEITALYWGGNLIYHIAEEEDVWNPSNISGTIDLSMTPKNITLYLNGTSTNVPVDTTVTPRTFNYDYNQPLTNCEKLFWRQTTVGTIDNLPDTSQVTNMSLMFGGNTVTNNKVQSGGQVMNLVSINTKHLDTSNVTDMSGMFGLCQKLNNLDLSSFDTSNVTDMSYMFYSCSLLTNLNISSFDTSNVTNFNSMFDRCGFVELDISHFNFSNATSMRYMFFNMLSLEKLILNADFSKVTDNYGIFNSTNVLTQIRGTVSNINVDFSLIYCPLDNESAMLFINALNPTETKKTLSLKTVTYQTLDEEQIAIATSKGWTVTSGN